MSFMKINSSDNIGHSFNLNKKVEKITDSVNSNLLHLSDIPKKSNEELQTSSISNNSHYFKIKIMEIQRQLYKIQSDISVNQFQLSFLDALSNQHSANWQEDLSKIVKEKFSIKDFTIPIDVSQEDYKNSISTNNQNLIRELKGLSTKSENILANQLLVNFQNISREELNKTITNINFLSGSESFQNVTSKNVISLIE